MKYKSTPIDFSQFDSIGHGMVLTTSSRANRTPDVKQSRRTPSIGSTASSTGTTDSGGMAMAIPQPGTSTRDNRFNSLGRGRNPRPPIQPPAAPTPPVNYSATLPRQMPSDMRQTTAVPGRTPSFSHQQGPPQGYMQGMQQPPEAPPPPEMMGHRQSRSGPVHPQGMPPPPPVNYPPMGGQRGSIDEQRMESGRRSMGQARTSVGDRQMAMGGQRMSIDEPPPASLEHRMSAGGYGGGIPAPPPPPMMMGMGGMGGDMPPPPDAMCKYKR